MKPISTVAIIVLALLALVGAVASQDADIPLAEIINDDGGVASITGEVTYTSLFFTDGAAQPVIILEDQAGFVDRDEYYIFPQQSQTIGQITSDFFTSPFTYSLALPIEPQGSLRDVDNDGESDAGVMVFAVAYWTNTWGDPFLERRDQFGGGWSTAYVSTRLSEDAETNREVVGGKYLVYAPDNEQGFPSDFGDDGLLFTEDDPIVKIPSGYTVVDLDARPFAFDRSRQQQIDLIEPEGIALNDFSSLGFVEAFDEMVELFRKEYAFTEYKNIDWDALSAEFRPRFTEAEKNGNDQAYLDALREFTWRIPDGHVSVSPFTPFREQFQFDIALGIGLGLTETDDGRALVTFLLEDGPADDAGIELGAEIISLNGIPISDAISANEPWFQPYSTPHNLRLEQARFVTRFPADTSSVEIVFQNAGDAEATEESLQPVREVDSFNETGATQGADFDGSELPVEYDILDEGFGYISIFSFQDNELLTIQVWERAIRQLTQLGAEGLIVDMRFNGGGNPFLADQMTGYFFDEETVVGIRSRYNRALDDFFADERDQARVYLPPDESLQFDGQVVVLIGPSCASACERFAYNVSLLEQGEVIGSYPTAGLGGGVNDFVMPLGMTVRFTVVRSLDADGNIHIEGLGVPPTIRVPVNEETIFSDEDVILQAGIDHLVDATTIPVVDAGEIAIGDRFESEFVDGARIRYDFQFEANVPVNIAFTTPSGTETTIVRMYDTDDNLIFSNEETQAANGGNSRLNGLGIAQDLEVIIELATINDDYSGDYTIQISRGG